MRKKSLTPLYIALFFGLLLGGLIRLEDYLAQQLVGALGDEVHDAIPCNLEYDDASLSLIRLTGKVTNARIMCNKEPALTFKEVTADFSIAQIFSKRVPITQLTLKDGLARGVGIESATYKFIDYLSTPTPPEKDRPGRWHVILEKLSVINSSFIEDLGANLLTASGVSMEMHYDKDRNAVLKPIINSLNYVIRGKHPRTMPLGAASSTVTIYDDKTNFDNLLLTEKHNETIANADAIKAEGNTLHGSATHKASLSYMGLPEWLMGTLLGNGSIRGTLGSPIIEGSFTNDPKNETKVSPGGLDVVSFTNLTGRFFVDFNDRKPIVKVMGLSGSSEGATLSSKTGITINDEIVSGTLDLTTKSIVVGPVNFEDVITHIELSGTLGDVRSHSTGSVGVIKTLGTEIHQTTFDAQSEGDNVNFTALHTSPGNGTLTAAGLIDLSKSAPVMKQVKYTLSKFPFLSLYKTSLTPADIEFLKIDGDGVVQGPFSAGDVKTNATFRATSDILPVSSKDNAGKLDIASGKMLLTVGKDPFFKLTLGLTDTDSKGALSVSLNDAPVDAITKLQCSQATSQIDYTYERSKPWSGNGAMDLKKLQAGCPPDALDLVGATRIPIQNGNLQLKNVLFQGADSQLSLQGSLGVDSGWDLTTLGVIHLHTFQGALPSVDDISGNAKISLKIAGSFTEPSMKGVVQLNNSGITTEASGIDVRDVSGYFDFNGKQLVARDVRGTFNGGTVALTGGVNPFKLSESTLVSHIEGAAFSPLPNVSILISGDMSLAAGEAGAPTILGKLLVENAEFEKRIDLITLAKNLSQLIFQSKTQDLRKQTLPDINLAVDVSATRSIFIVTNYFGSELKGDLAVRGTLASPDITGSMESLSGWFGFRDGRFDITSGSINFIGGDNTPTLSLLGESVVRSKAGDTIDVYVEANGPITAPKVTFSSDSGLSQKEILALLTSGSQTSEQTLVNSIGRDVELKGYSPFEDVPILSYSRFLRNLTHIDSLSVEPQYNLSTGTIEPFVSARKKLTDLLSVVGESYLGSQSTDTRVGLVYNLFSNVNVAGYLATSSGKENASLEGDITLTILAAQKRFVSLAIEGNQHFSKRDILKNLRISTNSRILADDMLSIRQKLKKYYRARGFFDARIKSWCRVDHKYCRSVRLHIEEGPLSFVNEVRIDSDVEIPQKLIPAFPTPSKAINKHVLNTNSSILRWARSEGYISARVDTTYEGTTDPTQKRLIINASIGDPVSFIFTGNTLFTPEEFLESINLFGRKIPFGSNTINILIRNIEQMYKDKGYLDVVITRSDSKDPQSGRLLYSIAISEGELVKVSEVHLEGLAEISLDDLRALIKKDNVTIYSALFYPTYAIQSEIDNAIFEIVKILKEQGYTEASVSSEVKRNEENRVSIVYTVHEGSKEPSYIVSVSGLPHTDEDLPRAPKEAARLSEINRYIDQLNTALAEIGYRAPGISTEIRNNIFTIHLKPGDLTTVHTISFEGLEEVQTSAIESAVTIKPGDTVNSRVLNEIRQKLLSKGLFSRVEMVENDTKDIDQKDLVIRVTEKPLTTLDVGGGFNTEFGVHIFGEGTDRSLFADGRALILRLDAYVNSPTGESISKGVASMKYVQPSLLGSRYSLTEDLRYQKFNSSTQEFDLERTGLVSGIYRAWNNGVSLTAGHTISYETLNNVSPDAILSDLDAESLYLGFLSQTLQYDHRDNPLNPSRGYTLSLDHHIAAPFFGSDATFDELSGRISYIYPFLIGDTHFAFAHSLRLGTGWTFGATEYIPISQRYYLGGRNSIRGYKENSLGPRGASGSVIGGDSLAQNTFEFQYHPSEFASINLFLDAGNVYLRNFDQKANGVPSSIREEDDALFQYSTGLGLRYLSPIGPIGLDIGFPINGRETDDPWRVHFNIGTNF